jgi:hypothetical protein
MHVMWSRCGGLDCIRAPGLPVGTRLQVRPAAAAEFGGIPAMGGRLVVDGADLCFVPRFGFVDDTSYVVTIDGPTTDATATPVRLHRQGPERAASTDVLGIYPSAASVPRNLLRLYIWFSAPMSEGSAAEHLRLTDDSGSMIRNALLPNENELWDAEHRRLTVLLDPARIKQGLATHRAIGYPLRSGAAVRLVVDEGFRDARGIRLRRPGEREYRVGADERRHVDPLAWALTAPPANTADPLRVGFDRPLDHGLLARCLRVVGPDGLPVDGSVEIGPEERSWRLIPRRNWLPGTNRLLVDPGLEDLAGNSVARVFDRDLTRAADEPRPTTSVALSFRPGVG